MSEPVRPLIRPATVYDAEAIARVHVESWRTTYTGLLPQSYMDQLTIERRVAYWTSSLQREGNQRGTFVACDECSNVVGFVGCGPIRKEVSTFDGEIYVIYLLESAQGLGYGRALVLAAAAHLIALGLESLLLWVLQDNPKARGFYAALGGVDLGMVRTEDVHGMPINEMAYGWFSLRNLLSRLER
jgi:ribosomal protein S18 acetylase RimI-like enzyme